MPQTKNSKAKVPRVRKLTPKSKKKVVKLGTKLPGSFRILSRTFRHLWRNRKIFLLVLLVFGLLHILLVRGLALGFDLNATRDAIKQAQETEGTQIGSFETASALFGTLLGGIGTSAGEAASLYQTVLLVVFSLITIYTLRQTFDEKSRRPTLRQVMYQSTHPLIQYIMVCLVIILQLVPALISLTLFSIVSSNGIAVNALEQILWFLVLLIGIGVSVYMVSSSIFASYIVTLPNATPMQALRSARGLVRYRRWAIIRKALFLPLAIFVLLAVVFLPLALYASAVAEVLFLIVSLLLLFVTHTYFYMLYRELL